MARLSRTAKFADLREQMSNDRESAVYTEELGRYEDKLRGIQNNAYGTNENILRRDNVNAAPIYGAPNGAYGQVNYGGQQVNNPYVQPQANPYVQAQPQVNPYVQPQANPYVQVQPQYVEPQPQPQPQPQYVEPQPVQPQYVEPQYVEPQPQYVEPQPQPVQPQPVQPQYVEPQPIPQPVNEVPSFEEATKEFKPEQGNDDFFSFLNSLDTINLDKEIQETFDTTPAPQAQPVIIEAPKKEPDIVFDNTDDYADIARLIEQDNIDINGVVEPVKEEVKPVINNDFMANAINEVNDYNKNDGRKTIDELSASMVDAVRHPEANNLQSKDDEFSNTVSLEIDKVLNEIKAEPAKEEQTPVKEAEPVKEATSSTIEHPVLTKALEEEVVEIKSMEETLKQDVLDDTIPFVMNEDDEDLEEYEDEAPNKILNVILVVLIVILLAILGVIVYYILYAKGIIG